MDKITMGFLPKKTICMSIEMYTLKINKSMYHYGICIEYFIHYIRSKLGEYSPWKTI